MGEDMGSILDKAGFFFCQYILSKRGLLTSLNLSFLQVYQYFLISKQKKFLPHAGFEPGSLLNLISAWYLIIYSTCIVKVDMSTVQNPT
jgi:hypothetical protein